MGVTAVRIFYRKQNGQSVWTHELQGGGEFPVSVESDLAEVPGREGNGTVEDYGCYEVTDPIMAMAVLESDNNRIVDGELIIGPRRPQPPQRTPRNLAAEIDALTRRFDNEYPGGGPE